MRLCEEIGLEKLGWPVVVDIQNVSDYYSSVELGSGWKFSDLPPVAPPWPLAAYEFAVREGDEGAEETVRVSVLVEAVAIEDERGGWVLTLSEFLETPNRRPACLCVGLAQLEPGGLLLRPDLPGDVEVEVLEGQTGTDPGVATMPGPDWPEGTSFGESVAEVIHTWRRVFLANAFLGCSNVTIRDETPHLTRQQRRHGPPAVTYKVLDIAPMTRILHDEGGIERNGLKKALHICRGHFAHYGPDAKLFGKYEGTFWHPMHTRGSADRGVVVKDYKVSPHDAA